MLQNQWNADDVMINKKKVILFIIYNTVAFTTKSQVTKTIKNKALNPFFSKVKVFRVWKKKKKKLITFMLGRGCIVYT